MPVALHLHLIELPVFFIQPNTPHFHVGNHCKSVMWDIDQFPAVGKQSLTLIHFNIRSPHSPYEELEALIDILDRHCVIRLAET